MAEKSRPRKESDRLMVGIYVSWNQGSFYHNLLPPRGQQSTRHSELVFRAPRQRKHSISDHHRVLVVQCASTMDEAITFQPRERGHLPALVRGRYHINVSQQHVRLQAGI